MLSKVLNFFIDSGSVLTSPDELFYIKNQTINYEGIYSLLFYSAFLGLIIGIILQNLFIAITLAIGFMITVTCSKLIHSAIIYLFNKYIFKIDGKFISLFNLIGYSTVPYFFLIIGFSLLSLNSMILPLLVILTSIWEIILVITAVNEEYDLGYGKSFLASYGIILVIITIFICLMGLL